MGTGNHNAGGGGGGGVTLQWTSIPSGMDEYCKIPIISPGLIFVQKAFSLGLFLGAYFWRGLLLEGIFAFQNELGLTIKTA